MTRINMAPRASSQIRMNSRKFPLLRIFDQFRWFCAQNDRNSLLWMKNEDKPSNFWKVSALERFKTITNHSKHGPTTNAVQLLDTVATSEISISEFSEVKKWQKEVESMKMNRTAMISVLKLVYWRIFIFWVVFPFNSLSPVKGGKNYDI